ncbi:hypothetical protein QBC39DRAFT_294135 [Podospora conica]|nr:hypothetical protein QBC39DRAFT_294135 [Schizothecium conicum]
MHDHPSHPYLQQVPLTVNPFVNLPSATTLPYTYMPMPSTLPPSTTGVGTGDPRPRYVVSATGHAAHPDDILASCRALQAHIAKLQAEADADLRGFEERRLARELAEKRRVAPGWLDSEARLLEPERKTATPAEHEHGQLRGVDGGARGENGQKQAPEGVSEMGVPDEGEQLDRAFGGLGLGVPPGLDISALSISDVKHVEHRT